MLLTVLYLLGFLALLVLGAWCVSEGGDILGDKYDATIIGGFVISWLNTAPETIFFITALETGNPNFAVGAISGSVIVVCTVAVGSCVYIGASRRKAGTIFLLPGVRKQAMMLGGSLSVMLCVLVFGFKMWIGVFGILYYVGFICWTIFHKAAYNAITSGGLNKSPLTPTADNTDLEVAQSETMPHHHDDHDPEAEDEEEQPTWKGIAYLVAGGVLIYLCSEPFIQAVVRIGGDIGLTPLALAFFFAPIASEAPEILESISLSRKGKTQSINIAFSNLVGGTLSKTTLLLGILCIYSVRRGYEWVSPAYTISMVLVLMCAASSAMFGLSEVHGAVRGQMLAGLFLICSIVQFLVAYHSGDTSLANI